MAPGRAPGHLLDREKLSMLILERAQNKREEAPLASGETPSLRERKKQDKLRRIRDAAFALFSEKGFEATTTREIAERAGIGAGTLFLYVRTKEELLALLFRDEFSRITDERFETLDDEAPFLDQLVHLFEGFFGFYERDKRLARVLVREVSLPRPEQRGLMDTLNADFLSRLAALVERAQARGEVRDDVASLLAAASLFGVYVAVLFGWLSGGVDDGEPRRAVLAAALRLHIEGLAPGSHLFGRRP